MSFLLAISWVVFWGYSALIVASAFLPGKDVPTVFNLNDKGMHFVGYFLLSMVAWNAFRRARFALSGFAPRLEALIYCLFIGAFTEWIQQWVPTRSCDLLDWVSDAAGGLAGWTVILIALHGKPEHVFTGPGPVGPGPAKRKG